MKKLLLSLLVSSAFLLSLMCVHAESTFAGVLLSGRGEGFVAGNIQFTVRGGQVDFQSTLFQHLISSATLEPVLVVQNKVVPLDYGDGVPGRFELGEFLGPIPGWDFTPVCGWEYGAIDPGFGMPWYSDGIRFTGSTRAFPGLENLLRARGGTLWLQLAGEVGDLHDPLFSAPLVEGWPPRKEHFSADLSGANEIPPNTSSFHASASFSLAGTCLNYSLTWDRGLPWVAGGIFGPAGHHSTSTNFIADLSTPQRFSISGGPDAQEPIVYHGAVSLSEDDVKQLKLGKLYVNLLTAEYPGGEIRGQILPVAKEDRKLNPK